MGVWIVIPAHGRPAISAVAFAGIAWALGELDDAEALVVADDENLDIARACGLRTLERRNDSLGRKWNDAIEHACSLGATQVITCGSDDWVHPDLIHQHLDQADEQNVMCSRQSAVIAPDGREAVTITVRYAGGDGVRMIPRELLERLGFRPYLDNRSRALDGGMFDRLTRSRVAFEWAYNDLHPWQIVDFKSGENITDYDKFPSCEHAPQLVSNPFAALAEHYPAALVEQARSLYGVPR